MNNFFKALILFSLIINYGCSATSKTAELNIFWPAPPEEPRIAYLNAYRGEMDFKKYSIWDTLFGAEVRNQMIKPYGVTTFGEKIYLTLTGSSSVMILDLKEQKVDFLGSGFGLPVGIASAPDGTIYVTDAKQKRVFGFGSDGKLKLAFGDKVFQNPSGIAVNSALNRVYVVDSGAHELDAFSLKGEFLFKVGGRGSGDGEFNYPSNIAIDRRTNQIYVVDTQNFRVQVFDQDGKFLRRFGSAGDVAGSFTRPKGIGVDSEGHVYVVDAAFANFQIFDENGELLMFIGGHGNGPSRFSLPAGLYIDENDRVYAVDQLGSRLQVFQYLSAKWKREHPEEYKKYLLPSL